MWAFNIIGRGSHSKTRQRSIGDETTTIFYIGKEKVMEVRGTIDTSGARYYNITKFHSGVAVEYGRIVRT